MALPTNPDQFKTLIKQKKARSRKMAASLRKFQDWAARAASFSARPSPFDAMDQTALPCRSLSLPTALLPFRQSPQRQGYHP
jgi:hypothetical protein